MDSALEAPWISTAPSTATLRIPTKPRTSSWVLCMRDSRRMATRFSTSASSQDRLSTVRISTTDGEGMLLSSRLLKAQPLELLRKCVEQLSKSAHAIKGRSESTSASTSSAGKNGRRNYKTTLFTFIPLRCSASKNCGQSASKWRNIRYSEIALLEQGIFTTFTSS